MGPGLSLASILGSAGPQAFDPMELLSLFQQGGMPQLPRPPTPVQSFEGLPPEIQGQGNRQGILTLATLLGAASPGQIGTSIAQAAGSIDPIRRGFTEDYNLQEMERYRVESQRAQVEAAFAQEQQERQRREQMTREVLGRAGELAQQNPESAGEIRDLLLSAGGDPQAAMGALMDWQAQKEQEAAQAEQQATLANALSERGIPGEMGMFPSQAGNLMEESAMRDLGLGRYEPETPPQGSWTSAGNGYVFNTAQGPGSARQIYQPEPAGGSRLQVDWETGQRFDPETGDVLPPPEGFSPSISARERLLLRALGQMEGDGSGPGEAGPPLGTTAPPAPEPATNPRETSVESKLQAIEQTAGDMGLPLTREDLRAIRSDLLRGATVQQVMQQLLGGG